MPLPTKLATCSEDREESVAGEELGAANGGGGTGSSATCSSSAVGVTCSRSESSSSVRFEVGTGFGAAATATLSALTFTPAAETSGAFGATVALGAATGFFTGLLGDCAVAGVFLATVFLIGTPFCAVCSALSKSSADILGSPVADTTGLAFITVAFSAFVGALEAILAGIFFTSFGCVLGLA